jgi:hypothetical protein
MYRTMFGIAALVLLVLPALAQERRQVRTVPVEVSGVVVDADGNPVAGVTVTDRWGYDNGWQPAGEAATTDAEGRFTISVNTFPDLPPRNYRIQAGDNEGKLGAMAIVDADGLKQEVRLALQPYVTVKGTVTPPEGVEHEGGLANFSLTEARVVMANLRYSGNEFTVKLLPGEYVMRLSTSRQFRPVVQQVKVEAGAETLELNLKLELTEIAQRFGKPAYPLTISHIRNLPEDLAEKGTDVTLADFKGRWVLLEFWGYW